MERLKKTTKILGDSSSMSHDVERARAQRDARDIEIINRNADRLNADAEDALRYQAPWGVDDQKESRPAKKKKPRG